MVRLQVLVHCFVWQIANLRYESMVNCIDCLDVTVSLATLARPNSYLSIKPTAIIPSSSNPSFGRLSSSGSHESPP